MVGHLHLASEEVGYGREVFGIVYLEMFPAIGFNVGGVGGVVGLEVNSEEVDVFADSSVNLSRVEVHDTAGGELHVALASAEIDVADVDVG